MIPDLASYDVIEVSTSAGKDSLAMLAYVAELARAAGVLDRVVAVHADLGRVEWHGTRGLAEEQARALGLRFMLVKRTQGDLLEHVERYGKWPTPSTRYCTADHKRQQIHRALTALANEVRATWPVGIDRPVRVLNCVGLRAEESPGRAKRPSITRDKRASSGAKIVDVWLPIQQWTEAKVWAACRASGLRTHPAYAVGLPRASCVFCIFAPEAALQIAALHNPELLAEYVRVEQAIGHTFKRHLPIAKVASDIAAGIRPSGTVTSWCM